MTQATSVVTPERFDGAMSYASYLNAIAVNRDQFEHYYNTIHLGDEDVRFFRQAALLPSGPVKILVISEPWCPDVFRGVPVFARIAEAAGMTMRIVPRDENPDIMDEFLLNGTARAVPVAVFYTREHGYLAHWIERPAVAHAEIGRLRKEFAELYPHVNMKKLEPGDMETLKTFFDPRLTQLYPTWQAETVREIRALLSRVLSL